MILTDTHAHFDPSPTAVRAVLDRAQAAGVARLLAVGGNAELNDAAVAAARAFPEYVRLAVGLDRDQVASLDAQTAFDARLADPSLPPLAAIGETGLDYHHRPDTRPAQCALFADMLRLADALRLPAVIHTREADDDTLRVLDEAGSAALRSAGRLGVVHCFTGGEAFARDLLDRGLYLGISGIVTFRNADALRLVARFVPADRLLLETDSPFLAPVPKRGQRNEPAFIVHVAECVAGVRGIPVAELAAQTGRNAENLFGPWPPVGLDLARLPQTDLPLSM